MIFGATRERFISNDFPEQLKLALEPRSQEIEQTVKKELESIRVSYLRKNEKKSHPGRLALPSHLPEVEAIVEPQEDTTGMVCVGREVAGKFIFHLHWYRNQQRIDQMGVSVLSSTFESRVKLGAEQIQPLFAVHHKYVFREIYQQIDESPCFEFTFHPFVSSFGDHGFGRSVWPTGTVPDKVRDC